MGCGCRKSTTSKSTVQKKTLDAQRRKKLSKSRLASLKQKIDANKRKS